MKRLPRPLTLATALVLAIAGLGSCGYVRPPALTIAKDSSSEPFYTFTADELFAEVAKASGAAGPSTTKPASVETERIAEILTGKVRPKILKQVLADRNVAVTDADRQAAQQASQQQQQQQEPSPEEADFRTDLFALSRVLGDDFFSRPGNDIDEYARKYYDQRQQSFAQPAQTCLHVLTVDAGDGQTQPTEEQVNAQLPKAQELRRRLNSEPFEKVFEDSGRSAQGLPGGDFKCQTDDALPSEALAAITAVPVGTISQPIKWRAGWVIVRIDDRKVARTPPYEEVRTTAQAATRSTFGQQFVNELLDKVNKQYVVTVDPRFGRWHAEQGVVTKPDGAAAPTMPTTTTTLPPLDETPSGTAPPGSTPPGSAPAAEPNAPTTTTTRAP